MSKKISFLALLFVGLSMIYATNKNAERYYYEIRIYHLKNKVQEARMDKFLQTAYLPALHRAGIKQVGVLKPLTQDTTDLLIYLFIPFRNPEQFQNLTSVLNNDKKYLEEGNDYLNATYKEPLYTRIESILLQAFKGMPSPASPKLTAPKNERFYELRSYESATESYAENKIEMFNEYEIGIFKKLDFNAVFYGQVLIGSRMPNLMYMTTFNSKEDRDKHWEAFMPEYEKIKFLPEYQNNVSKNVQVYLYPTDYSDL